MPVRGLLKARESRHTCTTKIHFYFFHPSNPASSVSRKNTRRKKSCAKNKEGSTGEVGRDEELLTGNLRIGGESTCTTRGNDEDVYEASVSKAAATERRQRRRSYRLAREHPRHRRRLGKKKRLEKCSSARRRIFFFEGVPREERKKRERGDEPSRTRTGLPLLRQKRGLFAGARHGVRTTIRAVNSSSSNASGSE